MASTSKQKHQQKRDWLNLPSDVTANILCRIGVFDILENAQKVCTSWRKICNDPAMWRVIHLDHQFSDRNGRPLPEIIQEIRKQNMCKHAVDRSQGQLVEISIVDFADDELVQYIAHRSSQLKCLEITMSYSSFYYPSISKKVIETLGRCCPLLKTLKMNQEAWRIWDEDMYDAIAIAIGENLRELRHLELIGNGMTNIGLKAIMDNCSHLESLDLRRCLYINLKGDLGKRCREQIKCVKFPKDSLEGCPYIKGYDIHMDYGEYDYNDYEYDYEYYVSDYDEFGYND